MDNEIIQLEKWKSLSVTARTKGHNIWVVSPILTLSVSLVKPQYLHALVSQLLRIMILNLPPSERCCETLVTAGDLQMEGAD